MWPDPISYPGPLALESTRYRLCYAARLYSSVINWESLLSKMLCSVLLVAFFSGVFGGLVLMAFPGYLQLCIIGFMYFVML